MTTARKSLRLAGISALFSVSITASVHATTLTGDLTADNSFNA